MKNALIAGAVLAASFSGVTADLCSEGSTDDNGNWYCQQVNGISYTGLDGSGSYQRVTSMDATSGACEQTTQTYSGTMSPLDQELSLHFRGPLVLNKFAAYSSGATTSMKKHKRRGNSHRHGHARFHEHQREVREAQEAHEKLEKRQCGAEVTATINGQVQTWANTYGCPSSAAAAAPSTAASRPAAAANQNNVAAANTASSSSSAPSATASSGYISNAGSASASGSWSQTAYYDSSSSYAKGLTFLNHMGGTAGSGTWSAAFGNSLSYAASNGCDGASSPQVLANTQLSSTDEIVILTDNECSNGDCGYYTLPGTVAYHGFDGPEKAFYFEFSMPQNTSESGTTSNMPAIWALNAQIPLTSQYAENHQCNCWQSGCGEMDIFEVLAPGDTRAKSTLHGNSPCNGGDSDYFARPVDGPITVGVIMLDGNIHMQVVDNFDWPSTLSSDDVNGVATSQLTQNSGVSIFALAS